MWSSAPRASDWHQERKVPRTRPLVVSWARKTVSKFVSYGLDSAVSTKMDLPWLHNDDTAVSTSPLTTLLWFPGHRLSANLKNLTRFTDGFPRKRARSSARGWFRTTSGGILFIMVSLPCLRSPHPVALDELLPKNQENQDCSRNTCQYSCRDGCWIGGANRAGDDDRACIGELMSFCRRLVNYTFGVIGGSWRKWRERPPRWTEVLCVFETCVWARSQHCRIGRLVLTTCFQTDIQASRVFQYTITTDNSELGLWTEAGRVPPLS